MSELLTGPNQKSSVWESAWVNTLGRFAALLVVFAFFAWMVDGGKFYSPRNLESIALQSAVYATAALGMTLVIITAGIDLSVGAVIALTVVGVAWILNLPAGEDAYLIDKYPVGLPIVAVLGGMLLATLAGIANGMMIVGLRITPFIVTLGTMGIFRGLAKGISNQKSIYPPTDTWVSTIMEPTITNPDRSWMLLAPGLWILLVAILGAIVLLRFTRLGRHIYAIGSNEETARLCGVPVGRTKIVVYMLAGFFAGLAGLMQFSFISGIGEPNTGIAYELFVIAAVVIGGASLMGGEGTILGSILGAVLITVLYMGGAQMDWPKWIQEMAIGGIIIGAVALDQLRQRGKT